MTKSREILRWLVATTIGIAAIPLTLIAIDFYFGLCSLMIVPVLAATVWLTLSADEGRRVWWFGIAITFGALLPACPVMEQWFHNGATYLQHLTQTGVISLSQRIIEPGLIFLEVICPPMVAALVGVGVGGLLQRLVRRGAASSSCEQFRVRWRFSIREMLVAFAAVAILSAWTMNSTREWENQEKSNQDAFLNRFKESFTSHEVELLAEPRIEELQRSRMAEYGARSFRPPGVNEYRIVAPTEANDKKVWRVWSYTCNEEAGDMIYMYASAEARDEQHLPEFPFPAKRYIEIESSMVDGVPATAGPTAIVTSLTSPARVDRPLVLAASAPSGTVCELHTFPRDMLPAMPPQTPDKTGKVSWTWNVSPSMAGYDVNYVIHCIESHGSERVFGITRGSVTLVGAEAAK